MNSLVNKLRLGNTEPFGPFWTLLEDTHGKHRGNSCLQSGATYHVVPRHHIFPWCACDRTRKPPRLVCASPPPFHSHIYWRCEMFIVMLMNATVHTGMSFNPLKWPGPDIQDDPANPVFLINSDLAMYTDSFWDIFEINPETNWANLLVLAWWLNHFCTQSIFSSFSSTQSSHLSSI